MELPYGILSHDTFGRIFEKMNPKEFQDCFKLWIESVTDQTKDQLIAIDGKTLRRSHDKSGDKKAIHMISAWASANQVVLALKKNHKTLYNDVTLFFKEIEDMKSEGFIFDEDKTVNGGHGRIETRKHLMSFDISWLQDKENWPGLKSIGMVENIREIKGECSHEK